MQVIEQNIPLPKARTRGKSFPAKQMNVGSSVFFPVAGPKMSMDPEYQRLMRSVSAWNHRTRMKFSLRTVEGGVRIWRTE